MSKKFLFLLLAATTMIFAACGDKNEPNINENGSGISSNPPTINDVLPGIFSISPTMKVQFSRGNLQYQASTGTWRFAAHQYDTIGAANALISETYSGWIDLFSWGTGNKPTKRLESDDYSEFVDWGTNIIGTNAANTFRTLTANEWDYLFYSRPGASGLWGRITVNGVRGIVLLPDDYNTYANNYSDLGINFPTGNSDYNALGLTAQQWDNAENYGLVFLPYTGMRIENTYYQDDVQHQYCFYWSASKNMNAGEEYQRFGITFYHEYVYGERLHYQAGYPYVMSYDWGGYGEAVRLVKNY